MSTKTTSDIIRSSVQTVLDLLSESESSNSDESDDDNLKNANSDLTTAVLIYVSTILDSNNLSEKSDDSDKEGELDNQVVSTDGTEETGVVAIDPCSESSTHPEDLLNFPGLPEFTSFSAITDIDFKMHFGVNKSTVELLKTLIPEKSALGRPQLNDLTFVLVSLWYLVTSEPHNSIAERFNLGKSHSHRVVVDFCTILTNLSAEYITWPDRNDAVNTIDIFKNNYGFPGVIGVLSHSHITIKCPAFDALNYCNSFGKYSVYLQTVVLPSLHFSYVFAGWPGSSNDEEVLHKSPIFPRLVTEPSTWVPDASHLLAKGPFTLQTFLLTAYKDNGCLSAAQTLYNTKHSQVCIVADYALGLLKNRFSRLTKLEVLKMDLLTKIIVACCVLHNICLEEGDTFQDLIAESSLENALDFEMASQEAELKRDTIANTFLLSEV